jgi:hypothetical protein
LQRELAERELVVLVSLTKGQWEVIEPIRLVKEKKEKKEKE